MSDEFVDAFQHELLEEKADALARAGKRLELAVERLRNHDRAHGAAVIREQLLWDLAERVEALVVQREACGLRDARYVLDFYSVPREVMARLGARRPSYA